MNKIRKISISIITLAVFLSIITPLSLPASAATNPDVDAGAAILAESETGQVLYAKNEHMRMYPASITKVMTALVALDAYQNGQVALNDIVTMPDNLYFDIAPDGSSQNLQPEEEMTFENLLYCTLMASANEACNAIAVYIAGDVDSFVARMNRMAEELGCTDTHFANTHGMPNEDHYTSAYDLFLIVQRAMEIPLFAKIVSTAEYTVPATNLAGERKLTNTNNLIKPKSNYYYEYAKGVKTGYTDAAGYCLASAAQKGDLSLISIVLKTSSTLAEDGTTKVMSFSESKRLFQWGFSNFSYRTVVSTMKLVKEIPVELGSGADSVVLRPAEEIIGLMDNDIDVSKVQMNIRIYSEETGETLVAPISAGDVLGEADVFLDGVSYGTIKLVANSSVELDRMKYIKAEVRSTMNNKYVKIVFALLIFLFAAYITFIILYNLNRRKKKAAADALARKRIEEVRRGESLSTGMTFEEIEERHARNSQYTRK